MQYIDSLTKNVIKGNLYVPVYGAGTCNTEFEVLTGVSTRLYTGDAICYVHEPKREFTGESYE